VTDKHKDGLLLGKAVPAVLHYSPETLYPIARNTARETLGLTGELPFHGADLWHAYELSWLDPAGVPGSWVGRLRLPATSPNMVESKSLKLYLNSLNNHRFASEGEAVATITADITAVVGAAVSLELFQPDAPQLAGTALRGACLDHLGVAAPETEPDGSRLIVSGQEVVTHSCFSHLLRSLCPVTGQPDWATVWLQYRGREIEPRSLLTYLLAFRQHQEFHEQCVERIFVDILRHCRPDSLQVQAFYTRRGGLDINPFRSTDPAAAPLPRLNRQ
jgi:7-cyano-7-deazaguanine reductase